MFDNRKPFATADAGGSVWYAWDGKNPHKMTKQQFAKLDWLGDCKQLVAEYAHLQVPRTSRSKSQVYTSEERVELLRNADRLGVSVFCFPQAMRPTYNPNKSKDIDDAIAMAEYLSKYVNPQPCVRSDGKPGVHCWLPRLKRDYGLDSPKWRAIHEFRDNSNSILNWARGWTPSYETEPDQFFHGEWRGGVDAIKKLADDARMHSTEFSDAGVKAAYDVIAYAKKYTIRYTIASMVMLPCGAPRTNPVTGKQPGIKWIMRYQLGFTNLHHRGGVARSNVQYHGLKNFLIARFKDAAKKDIARPLWETVDEVDKGRRENARMSLHEMNAENRELVVESRRHYRHAVKLYLAAAIQQAGERISRKSANLLKRKTMLPERVSIKRVKQTSLFGD